MENFSQLATQMCIVAGHKGHFDRILKTDGTFSKNPSTDEIKYFSDIESAGKTQREINLTFEGTKQDAIIRPALKVTELGFRVIGKGAVSNKGRYFTRDMVYGSKVEAEHYSENVEIKSVGTGEGRLRRTLISCLKNLRNENDRMDDVKTNVQNIGLDWNTFLENIQNELA